MTDLLCRVCDRDIFEKESKLYNYLTSFHKDNDKNMYKSIVINDVNLNEIDKIINDYIEIHNKKFNIYFIKCLFNISFDNLSIDLETNFVYNKEIYKINIELLFFIDIMKAEGRNFNKINQMTININSHICNMTDDYKKYSLSVLNPIGRKINIISGKNPQILNQITNNILIRKKSHIIFNI